MKFIEFTEEASCSFEEIDNQHIKMIDIVNNMYNSILINDKEKVLKQFDELISDLSAHFEYEEAIMKETKFQGYISHKLEHDRVLKHTKDDALDFKNGKINFGTENMKSFKTWFYNHLDFNDKKLGKFLAEKGEN
ncbi:MAG: hemerythrin family protein [Melioribacteraceae bacterium]|nr:hemerythrin family protein [Melioribacteraceae bacterium]